jgi:ACR3 family arsenite efflux pump ArsB
MHWLLKSLLILIVFVPVAAGFPLAAVALSRTPEGAQILFWLGPWSAAFWVLIYSTLSGVPWRQGSRAVHEYREAHGGLLVASMWATAWMFFGLFASYAAEFLMIIFVRPSPSSRALLPLFTYSPVAFCWVWRRVHA